MLFPQADKLKPRFCSGAYRPFLATPKLLFSCSFVIHRHEEALATDIVYSDVPACS
jgi:hypothetical protein